MRHLWHITIWFVFSLAAVFLITLRLAGSADVLKHAAAVKPYAPIFQTATTLRAASPRPETLLLFFGDSSVAQPPWASEDSRGIPALLEEALRKYHPELLPLSVMDWSFAGGRPFHYYCLSFEAKRHDPALLIIPVNWRALGAIAPAWNEKFPFPELSASVPFHERATLRGDTIFRLENISKSDHILAFFLRPVLYLRGLRLWVRTELGMETDETSEKKVIPLSEAKLIIGRFSDRRLFRQYANVIENDNPQLVVLRELADASSRRGIHVLFYITPIHLQEMRRREGFRPEQFQASLERVTLALRGDTSYCLDLSGLLGEEDFIDNFEHYTPAGNRKIAHALAAAVIESVGKSAMDRSLHLCREEAPPN
jgi:hypothetical protein